VVLDLPSQRLTPDTTRAAIFDMDGLLLDSEPLWWRAGVEVLRSVGVHLQDADVSQTIGLRTDAAVAHWYRRFPWAGKSCELIEAELQQRALVLISDLAQPLPGVMPLVQYLSEQGIAMGLCSSSPYTLIHAVLAKLRLSDYFRVVYSAEDEPFGKPHPGAYLSCAARLGVAAQRCVAFEDSLPGAQSAKAAQMKVVAVPNLESARSANFDFCDLRLESLAQFSPAMLAQLLPAQN
jgi:mannitol-1-/sugar-/sorbitol-6-/2-deoxyglucose-6-phosphatase